MVSVAHLVRSRSSQVFPLFQTDVPSDGASGAAACFASTRCGANFAACSCGVLLKK